MNLSSNLWHVDYDDLLSDVTGSPYLETAAYLLEQLPFEWRDRYLALTPFATDIAVHREGQLSYLFDYLAASDAEVSVVPVLLPERTKEPRMIAVYGYSSKSANPRPPSSGTLMRSFVGPTEKYFGPAYDKGHFVAHALGGSVNMNLFPQARHINRGWSPEGKRFAAMEAYCRDNPGSLLFSRPLYSDFTSRPAEVEFGVLRSDGKLWTEIFTNAAGHEANFTPPSGRPPS